MKKVNKFLKETKKSNYLYNEGRKNPPKNNPNYLLAK